MKQMSLKSLNYLKRRMNQKNLINHLLLRYQRYPLNQMKQMYLNYLKKQMKQMSPKSLNYLKRRMNQKNLINHLLLKYLKYQLSLK